MKKLIISYCILIFITITSVLLAQNKTLLMDAEVEPFLEQFVQDGKDRGFYLRSFLIQRIDSIYFHNGLTGTSIAGAVSVDMRTIYLNPIIKKNSLLLRTTLYHEIGHVVKKSGIHTCDNCYNIMSKNAPEDDSKYLDNEFWHSKVDEYFIWLNNKN